MIKLARRYTAPALIVILVGMMLGGSSDGGSERGVTYPSPLGISVTSDGRTAFVAEHAGGVIAVVDLQQGRLSRTLSVEGQPSDVLTVGDTILAGGTQGLVAPNVESREPRAESRQLDVKRAAALNARVTALTASPDGPIAVVDNWNATVLLLAVPSPRQGDPPASSLPKGGQRGVRDGDDAPQLLARWAVDPNPQQAAFTPDGKRLLVTCDSPGEPDRTVCVIDVATGQVQRCRLSASSLLRGIAVSPDGRFALVAHVRPRANLPATQVSQGWVFTNVISYIPLDALSPLGRGAGVRGSSASFPAADAPMAIPLPLDDPGEFYATPFDVVITPDGKKSYVSHAGADVVSVIDVAALEQVARKLAPRRQKELGRGENLRLTRRYVKARIPVGANPRRMALSPDGTRLVVANYLGDSLTVIATATDTVEKTIALTPNSKRSPAFEKSRASEQDTLPAHSLADSLTGRLAPWRRGQILFNSARLAFQGQFSCASCHPDGGSDGLNWDLPSDGIGNFHNSKSLIGSAGTEPFGWLGNSRDFPARFGSTLRTLFQYRPTDEELAAISAYLTQLQPPDLPPRVDPESESARRGRELFEGNAGCIGCHSGSRYTDRRLHDVGTAVAGDLTEFFDTPSLIGVSETAPFLHHGRAKTLDEVFTRYNPAGLHGNADKLSEPERADLIAFLKSL